MLSRTVSAFFLPSPSVWREWIEMAAYGDGDIGDDLSPSVWREWIEMTY